MRVDYMPYLCCWAGTVNDFLVPLQTDRHSASGLAVERKVGQLDTEVSEKAVRFAIWRLRSTLAGNFAVPSFGVVAGCDSFGQFLDSPNFAPGFHAVHLSL